MLQVSCVQLYGMQVLHKQQYKRGETCCVVHLNRSMKGMSNIVLFIWGGGGGGGGTDMTWCMYSFVWRDKIGMGWQLMTL